MSGDCLISEDEIDCKKNRRCTTLARKAISVFSKTDDVCPDVWKYGSQMLCHTAHYIPAENIDLNRVCVVLLGFMQTLPVTSVNRLPYVIARLFKCPYSVTDGTHSCHTSSYEHISEKLRFTSFVTSQFVDCYQHSKVLKLRHCWKNLKSPTR